MTKTIKASEFKAKCLKLMDEISSTGETVVVTKNGVPVVQVMPAKRKPKTLLGAMQGRIQVLGDLDEPLDVEWDAMR